MQSPETLNAGDKEIDNGNPDIQVQALDFARTCSDFLGVSYNARLSNLHLQRLAEHFDLTPVAFTCIDNDHWTLVVGKTDQGVEVYNPLEGLQRLKIQDVARIWYFTGNHRWQRVPQYFVTHSYQLPRERLQELGILQPDDSGPCGPLCIYAAKYAKEK